MSNMALISDPSITSGGHRPTLSPPTARQIRPSSSAKRTVLAPRPSLESNGCLVRLSLKKLERADEADAARLPHQRMVDQRLQAQLENRRHALHVLDDFDALVDLDGLERDGAGKRMAGVGEAVGEHALLAALLQQPLVDGLRNGDGAQRHVGRGDGLGHGHGGGLDVERLRAPPVSRARKAADHLVGDEGDVVLGQHRLHLLEIGLGRNEHAAGAHHRLGDEGGNRLRPFGFDQRLEASGETGGILLLALTGLGILAVVRAVGVEDACHRQVEVGVEHGEARQAGSGDGGAVIGVLARDDLLLLRAPHRVVVVPGDLDLGVVGLRAGVGEEHLGGGCGRQGLELLGERNGRLVAAAAEQVREGEARHLLACGLDELRVAVAEPRAPQPGQALDVSLAGVVVDVDAFAALQYQRPRAAVGQEVGGGMQQGFHVTRGEIRERAHRGSTG